MEATKQRTSYRINFSGFGIDLRQNKQRKPGVFAERKTERDAN